MLNSFGCVGRIQASSASFPGFPSFFGQLISFLLAHLAKNVIEHKGTGSSWVFLLAGVDLVTEMTGHHGRRVGTRAASACTDARNCKGGSNTSPPFHPMHSLSVSTVTILTDLVTDLPMELLELQRC